ncbi:hypothetical protein GCM10020295_49800 [Streptomyces cinereospinus]
MKSSGAAEAGAGAGGVGMVLVGHSSTVAAGATGASGAGRPAVPALIGRRFARTAGSRTA